MLYYKSFSMIQTEGNALEEAIDFEVDINDTMPKDSLKI